jgi:hypothetical protein
MRAVTSTLAAAAGTATGLATTAVGASAFALQSSFEWARSTAERSMRLMDTAEVVLDELLVTLREVRPLLRRIDAAVEGGVLDDLGRMATRLDDLSRMATRLDELGHMASRLDELMDRLGKVANEAEARLPSLQSLAATQADVEGARRATERLVNLVDTTLTQLDSLPGAGLVRKRISRVAAESSDGE